MPAAAADLDYGFSIPWQTDALAGTVTTGTFSFDATLTFIGSEFFATSLLTAFAFTSGGQGLQAETVDTGWLRFASDGSLTGAAFGANCNPTCSASLDRPGEWWINWSLAGPRAAVAAIGSSEYSEAANPQVTLAGAVPEPGSWLLMALGLVGLAAGAGRRR